MYPQVFGKYVLERELSRGGMARVVLATLRGAGGFEKRLVVKQIRDELAFDNQFVRRFVEEAKTTVMLSHPNIVPVYELGVEQGTYFLAMELVEGLSIAELLRERNEAGDKRVLSPEEGAYVGMEVCRALDYAHRRMNVVHRDITPRNVMLDEEGQVKLIDFGIAAPALVEGHEILGSPGHMPPEQIEGKELGPATDIFAVAVLLMEAWSGIAPFRRATPEECYAAMRAPHPKPSDFDPRLVPLDDVIVRALDLDPRERQQDATELGRVLRAYIKGIDVTDVARALGDRVRDAREIASQPAPQSRAPSMRATNPSHGDLGTQTFAARDEALHWSNPPPPPDVPGDAPSTRRLGDAIAANPKILNPRAKADPAMAIPTPLMVETNTAEVAAQVARAKRAHEDRMDTIATRPLETPVHFHESRPVPAARSRSWVWLGLAVLAVGGGVAAWRAKTTAAKADVPVASTTTSATPTNSVASATPSATAPPPSLATSTAPPSATQTQPAPSSSVLAANRAQVVLVGDPGTRVSIDGVSKGACPARVFVEPGSHEARFTFDPTGESRGERISLKAGDRIVIRAEFTGATPTIKIIR